MILAVFFAIPNVGSRFGALNCYRTPDYRNLNDFFSTLDAAIQECYAVVSTLVLAGDLNINLLDDTSSSGAERLKNLLMSKRLFMRVQLPTRQSSGTLIDVIAVSTTATVRDTAIDLLPPEITDHSMITCTIDLPAAKLGAEPASSSATPIGRPGRLERNQTLRNCNLFSKDLANVD
jgi:hypothetical protein